MGAPAVSTPRPRTLPKARPAGKPRSAAGSAARTKPKSRPAARATAGPVGVAMLPVAAVGRTAAVVGALPDCSVVVGMTRSRLWIGVLGVLLGGIVALNVWGLSLSAANSETAAKIDALQRDNSVFRARSANLLSNDKIEEAAASLGLAVPPPDSVHYLDATDSDAAKAASRLADGLIAAGAPVIEATSLDTATAPVDPAAVEPAAALDPAAVAPVEPVTDPAAVAAPVEPAAPTVPEPEVPAPAPIETATVAPTTVSASGGAAVP